MEILMKRVIPIAICSDNNYFMHALTLALSILDISCSDYFFKFYFCYRNIKHKNLKIIKENIEAYPNSEIVFVDLTKETEKFMTVSYINSKSMFDRIFLSDFVYEDKLLYLDCDMICASDISELFNQNIDNYYLGVVQDRFVEDFAKNKSTQYIETLPNSNIYKNWEYFILSFLKLPKITDYFNSGMLLMNLEKIRQDKIKEKLIAFIIKNQPTPMPDQDALNYICNGKIKYLSPRFNFVLSTLKIFGKNDSYVKKAFDRPVIIHHKFWNTSDFKTGYNKIYKKYFLSIYKNHFILLSDYLSLKEDIKRTVKPVYYAVNWLKSFFNIFVICTKFIFTFPQHIYKKCRKIKY